MIKNNFFILVFVFFFVNVFSQKQVSGTPDKVTVLVKKDSIFASSDTINKVYFNDKFQQKYQTAEFNYIEKKPSLSFFERFMDWLSHKISSLFDVTDPQQTRSYATNVLKFLALIIISIAIYFIVKIIINKEGNWIFGKSNAKKIDYDSIEENLQNIDFQKLIAQTNKLGNNRLEIRYYYLWVLQKLAEKEVIVIHPEKTNSDYLNEIPSKKIKADFKYISYLYNYVWYGEFDMTLDKYESSKETFVKMLQSI